MVGGSAAALLFHTLRIYIFTTVPEWPALLVTSPTSLVVLCSCIRTVDFINKVSQEWACNDLAAAAACILGSFRLWVCKTGYSRMKVTTNLTETCVYSAAARVDTTTVYRWQHSGAEISKCGCDVWLSRCHLAQRAVTYAAYARLRYKQELSNRWTHL